LQLPKPAYKTARIEKIKTDTTQTTITKKKRTSKGIGNYVPSRIVLS